MSAPNHQPVEGYAGGFIPASPTLDLWAFDQLPRTARRAIDEAPFAISARDALNFYRDHGYHALMREIKETIGLWFDAASRETGVPKPVGSLTVKRRKRDGR